MRWIALGLVACEGGKDDQQTGGDPPDGDGADADIDADTDADTDTDADADSDADADTGTVDPPTTADTGGGTSAWTDWSCAGAGCTWDCTGYGLRLATPGVYDVLLTAECTLEIEAWGAGGGGGGSAGGGDRGGGGGGGSTVIVGDDGTHWVIAGGGGGGGAGDGPAGAGGGGAGGHAVDVLTFAVDTHLALIVGGGGQPGCNAISGDGGDPGGGAGGNCSGDPSNYGGGGGRVAGCGSPGNSVYGGGGGGNGHAVWGGAGGGDSGSGCDGLSTYGGDAGCGPGATGGGGGGGGALGVTSDVGQTGFHGNAGSAGGSTVGGGAGGVVGAPAGVAPGGGGAGSGGCTGGAGGDGELTLLVTAGPGATCPADEIADCVGGCGPARWHGDGVCDADFDCVALASDDGDCPATGVQVPTFLQTACPAVTAEPTFCLTADYYDVALVGLTSGALCAIAPIGGYSYDFENLAWPPPYRRAYVCDYGIVAEYDLEIGGIRYSNEPCNAVTGHLDGLLVQDWLGYTWYATFDDLLAGNGTPIAVTVGDDLLITSDDAVLYGTWFSTDTLTSGDFATGNARPDVILENFNDWVHGLDVHQSVLHVVSNNDIFLFDPSTGSALGSLPISGTDGLECISP